jgi:hypothetical protein
MYKGLFPFLLIVTGVLPVVLSILEFRNSEGPFYLAITTLYFSTWTFISHIRTSSSYEAFGLSWRSFIGSIIGMILSLIFLLNYFF